MGNPNAKDIFLWADGFWCYRDDFDSQPRQTYTYRLVLENSAHWHSLTGAEPFSRPRRHAATHTANRTNSQHPTSPRR